MRRKERSTTALLGDIVLWGERAQSYVSDRSRDEFATDEMCQVAVSKCIEVIGEAAGRLLKQDDAFVRAHPELPLLEAYRMRNRLSHGYESIDWQVLWDTATVYVPAFVLHVRSLQDDGG